MENFLDPPSIQQPSSGNGHKRKEEKNKVMFGFIIFLVSESLVFVSFFLTYIILRLSTSNWLPSGVSGPELSPATITNTIVLLSSSLTIYLAERALKNNNLSIFRLLWLTTSAMGAYFLVGELREWQGLDFSISTGLVGSTFYLLTGFHGLHVAVGIFLQMLMLIRSFIRGNYNRGHYGVSAVSLFWHFVDVIWVILFSLLYLWQ